MIRYVQKFNLLLNFFQLRTCANASGAVVKFIDRDVDGSVKRISQSHEKTNRKYVDFGLGFAIHVPFGALKVKSVWSLACLWDARMRETTALFDGVSDRNLSILEDYMMGKQKHLDHPLILPIVVLEALCHSSTARRNVHQRSLYELEVRLG